MKEQLNELHLFAGAGGGILGGILCGHTTVCAVEIEPYCRKVLLQRQRDGILPKFPIWDDVQTFNGTPWRGKVDIVCGGFPCQDISAAGKGAGIEGSRSSMWKHMARIIGEVRPKYAFVENSPMLVGRGLSTVLSDLAEMGYDAVWGIVGAHHVAAPHKRDRIWILAADSTQLQRDGINDNTKKLLESQSISKLGNNSWQDNVSNANVCRCNNGSDSERQHKTDNAQIGQTAKDQQSGSFWEHRISENGCNVADSASEGLERVKWPQFKGDGIRLPHSSKKMANTDSQRFAQLHDATQSANEGQSARSNVEGGREAQWWASEPDVGRVAHGVASRVDRLKAIGNGQVPAVAQLAWQILSGKQQEKTIGT